MKLELKRFKETDKSTIGRLYVDDEFECYILENPYLDNKKNISCIPTGFYHWVIREDPQSKYNYPHIHVKDVPNRSWILFHIGNYPEDTLGCMLTGKEYGEDVVWNSTDAFANLMAKVSENGTLIITNERE